MHSKNLISVIIVAFKSHRYINKSIASILKAAKYAKLKTEIIVVINDKSNHNYKFPFKLKVIKNKKNYGYAKGINIGVNKASGEWLLVANPDTTTDKKALYFLSKHFSDTKIGIIGPKILLQNGTLQLTINKIPSFWTILFEQSYLYKIFPFILFSCKANKNNYKNPHSVEALEGTYLIIRKKLFDEIRGMDERFFLYFEDMDLCRKITHKGYTIYFEPKAEIIHLQSQSSDGVMLGKYYVESLKNYFLKHKSKLITLSILFIFKIGTLIRYFYWRLKTLLSKGETKAKKKRDYYGQLLNNLRNLDFI